MPPTARKTGGGFEFVPRRVFASSFGNNHI
jgi:hypothetical protein